MNTIQARLPKTTYTRYLQMVNNVDQVCGCLLLALP